MDSSELNRVLLDRFEDVCCHLFPNGKIKGNHFMIGGLDGSAGESMQITMSGAAAGRWVDFANKEDKGATPLWLWSKARGVSFKDAVRDAKKWANIQDSDYGIKRHKPESFRQPTPQVKACRQLEPNSKVMDYLVVDRRLDPLVLANAKVAESEDGEAVVIPYYENGEAEPFHVKRLKVERVDGKKEMYASTGTKRGLYGKHLIDDSVSEITITEGEFDALSYHSVSIPAVSTPNGVSDLSWIDLDWDWLERFERINVHFDNDDPGKLAVPEVCKRLGLHRCHIVNVPFKDANEALQEGFLRGDFLRHIAEAKQIELDEIKRATDYTEEVCDYFETDWSKRGWETPWPNLNWRVRLGEFTIFSGFSGSGKTIMLNQMVLHLITQGAKVMISSLEIRPAMTIYYLTRAALAKKNASREEIRACHDWLNDSILFHDCIGTVTPARLKNAQEYARKRHGINVVVVDSLFKCGIDPMDNGKQREFADTITTFCNNNLVHYILVAHARKVQSGNELTAPSKSDVAGSSDLTNAAFNVLISWRNKLKKRKLDEARNAIPPNDEAIAEWIEKNDGKLILDKQRFGDGEEGEIPLWFSPETLQFHSTKNTKRPYFVLK